MAIDLNSVSSPGSVRKMNLGQLKLLAEELRSALIKKLEAHGGHVGPNLGVVEATVALHYVFDTPTDKIVFDVSHQTYVHKMLTGRIGAFLDPARYDEVSGYTSPSESAEYDLFEIGHTSTSVSLATGLAKARDIRGGKENVVAFIGDASLGGGMALEGLNYAPELKSNFIVVLNDNQRSIAENHGSLFAHLKELRDSGGNAPDNIFKALGYEYIYVDKGNDVEALVGAFKKAKGQPHAVLVHINTDKGHGLQVAKDNKEHFHYAGPFDGNTGAPVNDDVSEDYSDIFGAYMLARMKKDPSVVTMTAGTPGGLGFGPARRTQAGSQFIDVGIAEQDLVAMAAGLAKGGARPVVGAASTFIQRAYDQLEHDVAINRLPAVFVLFWGSVFGINDITHLGLFDIPMISNIPGIRYLAPSSAEEYTAMIDQAIDSRNRPTVIKTPGGRVYHQGRPVNPEFDSYETVRKGNGIAIFGVGTFLPTALKAADILAEKGLAVTVINPRNLSDPDWDTLDTLRNYRHVITVEDGIADGGFGQKVASWLGADPVKVSVLGYKKEFIDRYDPRQVIKDNGMTPEQIAVLAQS